MFFIPIQSLAADACTHPKQYTVDKRCYVTDAMKQIKPYNAVVSFNDVFCTGTIVNIDDVPYVFTAKHCTDTDNDNESDERLIVKLQNGKNFYAYRDNVGDYDLKTHTNRIEDWAIYRLKKDINDVPFVYINSDEGNYRVRLVGHGTLKILSDKELWEFRQLYLDYLNEKFGNSRNKSYEYGYSHFAPGIDAKNEYVKQFINDMSAENLKKFFKDNDQLKYSECYYNDGKEIGCQSWGGNSGSGIFNGVGEIKAIHTTGNEKIGGTGHARGVGNIKL